ncbi:MAG: RNB domain-containing ribonuclease [Bacilli bacterium]|nr:RNB domain-containing ribonuclease [Bacilli bacterium]
MGKSNTSKKYKDKIISCLLQSKDRAAHESALFSYLGVTSNKQKGHIRDALNRMILDGTISKDGKKNMYRLKSNDYELGEVILNGYNDFAIQFAEKRESIKGKKLHQAGAYVGDTVLYHNKSKEIKLITEKKNNPIVFSCLKINGDIKPWPISFPCLEEFRFKDFENIHLEGDEVFSANAEYNAEEDIYECTFKEVIGKASEYNIQGKIILAANGYDVSFSNEALMEAERVPKEVYPEDMVNRIDLRGLKAFTLDCARRMDTYDDALSVEEIGNGRYMLYFHIIDTAHYVKPGSHLYKEARKRAKKIYMHGARYARNILPEKLSHGICSFVKGKDRLAKTITLEFDKDGNCVSYDFFDSVVNIKDNLCTRDADEMFEAGYDSTKKGYNPEYIRDMVLLKVINGFVKKEPFIGENCSSSDSMHSVLVNIIDYANERVANHFLTLPFIYKTFRYPTKAEINKKADEFKKKEWHTVNNFNYVKRTIIDRILTYYQLPHTSPYESAVADILSRDCCYYSSKNKGHFKYGVQRFTHVNSPTRSFVNLENLILFDMYHKEFDASLENMNRLENKLEEICNEFNEKYRKIEKLEKTCSGCKEHERELHDTSQGTVVERNGSKIYVHVPEKGMFRVYSDDSSIEVGTELIIKINRSPDDEKSYNAKILRYKNKNA